MFKIVQRCALLLTLTASLAGCGADVGNVIWRVVPR